MVFIWWYPLFIYLVIYKWFTIVKKDFIWLHQKWKYTVVLTYCFLLNIIDMLFWRFLFCEVPDPTKAHEFKNGYLMRKCCLESDGRRSWFSLTLSALTELFYSVIIINWHLFLEFTLSSWWSKYFLCGWILVLADICLVRQVRCGWKSRFSDLKRIYRVRKYTDWI